MKKVKLFGLLIVLIGLAIFAFQKYSEGPRNLENEESEISIDAAALLDAFSADEAAANILYLDKILEVEGLISSISEDKNTSIVLETNEPISNIVCEMAEDQGSINLKIGERIKIKGQCTGYLSDVILVKCIIIK